MILLKLMAIPFILAGIIIIAVLSTAVIMLPFGIFICLCAYKFDWREMLDMEFNTNLRKFETNFRTININNSIINNTISLSRFRRIK
jgi:hypothetical protein